MTQYAAYDPDLIWGLGGSEQAALDDAANMGPYDEEEHAQFMAELRVAECSPELGRQVSERGGNVAFRLAKNGVLVAYDENPDGYHLD